MRDQPFIRKFLASWLLVVFTISCIPKSFFHDLIADHQDVVSCEHPGKHAACVHPKGFNCSFEKLVVTTPYVITDVAFDIVKPAYFTSYIGFETKPVLPLYFFFTDSRGPPSIVAS